MGRERSRHCSRNRRRWVWQHRRTWHDRNKHICWTHINCIWVIDFKPSTLDRISHSPLQTCSKSVILLLQKIYNNQSLSHFYLHLKKSLHVCVCVTEGEEEEGHRWFWQRCTSLQNLWESCQYQTNDHDWHGLQYHVNPMATLGRFWII